MADEGLADGSDLNSYGCALDGMTELIYVIAYAVVMLMLGERNARIGWQW